MWMVGYSLRAKWVDGAPEHSSFLCRVGLRAMGTASFQWELLFGLSMRGLLSLSKVRSILDREQKETVTESRHPTQP